MYMFDTSYTCDWIIFYCDYIVSCQKDGGNDMILGIRLLVYILINLWRVFAI